MRPPTEFIALEGGKAIPHNRLRRTQHAISMSDTAIEEHEPWTYHGPARHRGGLQKWAQAPVAI
ncbi:MAG TPA: hypothetical protein VKV15_15225 [Bryobacteraceae bacterium]|nr:hypothetical protein [Bryobacteraceae bacterium]